MGTTRPWRNFGVTSGNRVGHLSEVLLIKFCVARKFEMSKVAERVEKHLRGEAETVPHRAVLLEYFPPARAAEDPCGFQEGATDREGNWLYFERPGNGGACAPSALVQKIYVAGGACDGPWR